MPEISAIVHTYNEESQIARCLDSLRWADEILLVDTYSTDRTVDIAQTYTDRILYHKYRNSAETKNWAIPRARYDWLVFLDADEVISPELAGEIRDRIGREEHAGYYVDREMYFWGRPLKSTYWNPNYQMRVFHRKKGRFEEREVHAQVILDGPSASMVHKIRHDSYPDLSTYLTKFNRFTTMEAKQKLKEGHRFSRLYFPSISLMRSFLLFLRLHFKRKGYRDGLAGFVLSLFSAAYLFTVDAKYWELAYVQKLNPPDNKQPDGTQTEAPTGLPPAIKP